MARVSKEEVKKEESEVKEVKAAAKSVKKEVTPGPANEEVFHSKFVEKQVIVIEGLPFVIKELRGVELVLKRTDIK